MRLFVNKYVAFLLVDLKTISVYQKHGKVFFCTRYTKYDPVYLKDIENISRQNGTA